MKITSLAFVNNRLLSLDLPYSFMEWSEPPPDDYFVGEYIENPSITLEENGFQETTFIIRGWTNGSWLNLETYKEKIEKNISTTAILEDGTGIAIFYESAMVVPTGVAGWKSIKINLEIQEWKVN